MSDWVWIQRRVIIAVHGEQLAEHGGASGIRDAGLLESALARTQHLAADGDPDVAALAAGELDEAEFAGWLRSHLAAREK